MSTIQLVEVGPDGKLFVPEASQRMLESVTLPIAVVGIAGKYRSGKSTLISRLVNKRDAFEVGHTVNSCTKGILLHNVTSRHTDRKIMVLDSEGLDALDSNIQHDVRIFALSVLISSTFVYNVQGALDETTLNSLKVVTDFVQMMCQTASDDQGENSIGSIAAEMPLFVTVVRDFSLKLERPDGKAITPDQWLEDALSTDTLVGGDKQEVRDTVKRLFPQRRCFTLPRPSLDEAILARMDEVSDDKLRPEFVQQLRHLQSELIGKAPVKSILGEEVTGTGLLRIVMAWLDAINDSRAPQIRESWALLGHIRAQETVTRLTQEAYRVTTNWADSQMSLADLQKALFKLETATIERFRAEVSSPGDFLNELRCAIQERSAEVLASAENRRIDALVTYLGDCRTRATELVQGCDTQEAVASCWDTMQRQMDEAEARTASMLQHLGPDMVGRLCTTPQAVTGAHFFEGVHLLLKTASHRLLTSAVSTEKMQEMQTTISQLQTDLQQARVEAQAQLTKVQVDLQSRHSEQVKLIEAAADTLRMDLEQKLAECNTEKMKTVQELASLCEVHESDRKQVSDLQQQLENELSQGKNCMAQIASMEEMRLELENAKRQLQMHTDKIVTMEKQNSENVQQFQGQLTESRQHAEECINAKKRKLEEVTNVAATREQELLVENQAAAKSIERQKQDNDNAILHLQAQLEASKRIVSDKTLQIQAFHEKESTIRAENEASISDLQRQITGAVNAHKHELVQHHTERRLEAVQEKAARSELETKISKLNMVNEQAKRSAALLANVHQEKRALRTETNNLRMVEAKLGTQCQMLRQQLNARENDASDLQNRLTAVSDRCTSLEHENMRLKHDISIQKAML